MELWQAALAFGATGVFLTALVAYALFKDGVSAGKAEVLQPQTEDANAVLKEQRDNDISDFDAALRVQQAHDK